MNLLTERTVILASASPRRLDLLRQVGVEPRVVTAEINEIKQLGKLSPEQLVLTNAQRKAQAVAEQLGREDALILAADTVVVCDGRLFGKPEGGEQARQMLSLLSGRSHSVFTGQCLIDAANGRQLSACNETVVSFAALEAAEIEAYVAGGEPLDKAGAYGMQGQAGLFVRRIEGDYSTVVGLSLPLLREMLRKL